MLHVSPPSAAVASASGSNTEKEKGTPVVLKLDLRPLGRIWNELLVWVELLRGRKLSSVHAGNDKPETMLGLPLKTVSWPSFMPSFAKPEILQANKKKTPKRYWYQEPLSMSFSVDTWLIRHKQKNKVVDDVCGKHGEPQFFYRNVLKYWSKLRVISLKVRILDMWWCLSQRVGLCTARPSNVLTCMNTVVFLQSIKAVWLKHWTRFGFASLLSKYGKYKQDTGCSLHHQFYCSDRRDIVNSKLNHCWRGTLITNSTDLAS